jgi:hypothetical protein
MVRPKASDRNKTIAACFAEIVTMDIPKVTSFSEQSEAASIDCKGPNSIYNAMILCLPSIVRESKEHNIKNRKGLTEIELNKVLVARGFEAGRRRVQLGSALIWHKQWFGRRWVNVTNAKDILHIKRGLQTLQQFSEAKCLKLQVICNMLSFVCPNPKPAAGILSCEHRSDELLARTDSSSTANGTTRDDMVITKAPFVKLEYQKPYREIDPDLQLLSLRPNGLPEDLPLQLIGNDLLASSDTSLDVFHMDHEQSCQSTSPTKKPSTMFWSRPNDFQDQPNAQPFALADQTSLGDCSTPPSRPPSSQHDHSRHQSPSERRQAFAHGSPPLGPAGDAVASPAEHVPDHANLLGDEGSDQAEALLQSVARSGLDCPDLRRLCTFGYCPSKVWGLLAADPAKLMAALHTADDAGHRAGFRSRQLGADDCKAGGAPAGEAELVFSAAEERMRQAMEDDGETGYLEVTYDPVSQRRAHVFLNDRFAALRGTTRPALLARLAAHTADLPSTAPDCLAALLHGLLHRREADCTQYMRWGCGGRGVLVEEHSRKRFDGEGRVVKVTDPSGFRTSFVREQHFAYFFRTSKYRVASSSHPSPAPPQVATAVREIAPAEYDAALRASPGACPLLCVAGDGRGGAELLADMHAERMAHRRPNHSA